MSETSKKIWKVGTLQYTFGGLVLLGLCLVGGDFPWALKDRAVGPAATILIKETIGVSEFVFSIIFFSFPNFTNIFLVPIVSYMSDRHQGKWGRRIPYMMFTMPFIVIGIYGLGLTPYLGRLLHNAMPILSEKNSMLLLFCISWVLLDFGTSLSGFLFNALVNDVVPTELLGRFFALFRMVSLGAGVLFNSWLIQQVNEHLAVILLSIGTMYGLGILLMCFKVKEGEYTTPPELEHSQVDKDKKIIIRVMTNVITYFRQSFSMPYYRWYMITFVMTVACFCPVNFYSLQYSTHIGLSKEAYGLCLVITYAISFFMSFIYGYLSDKFHPIKCGLVTLVVYMILTFVAWIFARDLKYWSFFFIAHGVISGAFITLTASLGSKLLPKSLFAQFNSAVSLLSAFFFIVFAPAMGFTIDILNNEYINIYLMGTFFTVIAFCLLLKLNKEFVKLGGYKDYQAPIPK